MLSNIPDFGAPVQERISYFTETLNITDQQAVKLDQIFQSYFHLNDGVLSLSELQRRNMPVKPSSDFVFQTENNSVYGYLVLKEDVVTQALKRNPAGSFPVVTEGANLELLNSIRQSNIFSDSVEEKLKEFSQNDPIRMQDAKENIVLMSAIECRVITDLLKDSQDNVIQEIMTTLNQRMNKSAFFICEIPDADIRTILGDEM